MAKQCVFDGPAGAVPALVASDALDGTPSASGASAVVRLRPTKTLSAGSAHRFRCPAGLMGIEGEQGLAHDLDAPFRTYGPLAVESMPPGGHDVAADDVMVQVVFANPVLAAEVAKHVTLARLADPGKRVRLAFSSNPEGRTHTAKVNLESDERYTLTVKGTLRDTFGQALGKDEARTFGVGDASPRLSMKRGIFAVDTASGKYPVWTRNLSRLDVTCARVPEARYAALLTGPMNYDSWYDAEQQGSVDYRKLGTRARTKRVTIARPKNKWHDARRGCALPP